MAGRFMGIKRVIIPIMTLIIMTSQLTGCSTMNSKEMVNMINKGQSISLEIAKPSYPIVVKGTQQTENAWTQLDALKTYNNGFRQSFDEIFNINIVTDNGINGKSGCIYVDKSGDRNGNTTLADAFRNKTFNKYWNNSEVRNKIVKIVNEAYTDIDKNESYAIAGALNAYFNILPDSKDPSSFNGSQSLSREQFYTLLYKSQEGVKEIRVDTAFETAVGGKTDSTKFAQEVDEFGFLSVANKSLDGNSYKGSISRAEAIYMIVNQNFPEKLSTVTGKEKAFKDTKNAGDLALKAGFKTKENKVIKSKDRWQSYTLAYMLQHSEKGMQEELYKTMVVAHNLSLVGGDESRWDEPISKAEAIMLVANVQVAKNKSFGYLSEAEYGKINPSKFKIATDKSVVLGKTEDGNEYGEGWTAVKTEQVPSNPAKVLTGGKLTLWQAKLQIDNVMNSFKGKGYSAEKLADLETQLAIDLGTTIQEIKRLPPQPPATVQKPVQGKENTPSAGTNKPSTGNTGGSTVGSGSTGQGDDNPATRNDASQNLGTVDMSDDEVKAIFDGN